MTDLANLTKSQLTKDAGNNFCQCNGALKEVHYTVKVSIKDKTD